MKPGPTEFRGRAIPIVDVDAALADVTKRLVNRFEGQVPPDVVAATVRSCAERLQRARIVEFVPLLTERQSIERLMHPDSEAGPDASTVGSDHG